MSSIFNWGCNECPRSQIEENYFITLGFIMETVVTEVRLSNCSEWIKELKGFRVNLFGNYFFNWHAKA